MNDITLMLQSVGRGQKQASEELLPLVYDELRRLATARMAREAAGQTLQPTALVHEAWVRLVGDGAQTWENRAHFFGAAAEAMRRILIENARRKHSLKAGGDRVRVELADAEAAFDPGAPASTRALDLLALDEALTKLRRDDPVKAELVKLRYFGGLALEEAGHVLGLSPATADRYWAFARAWLFRELSADAPEPPSVTRNPLTS